MPSNTPIQSAGVTVSLIESGGRKGLKKREITGSIYFLKHKELIFFSFFLLLLLFIEVPFFLNCSFFFFTMLC